MKQLDDVSLKSSYIDELLRTSSPAPATAPELLTLPCFATCVYGLLSERCISTLYTLSGVQRRADSSVVDRQRYPHREWTSAKEPLADRVPGPSSILLTTPRRLWIGPREGYGLAEGWPNPRLYFGGAERWITSAVAIAEGLATESFASADGAGKTEWNGR